MPPTARGMILLGVALGASVLGNVYLYLRASNDAADRAAATRECGVVAAGEPAAAGAAPRDPAATASAGFAATCPGQLSQLSARLAEAEARIEERMSADERFEKASATPESEAKVRTLIDDLMKGAPEGFAWDLECRADVCKLDIIEKEGGPAFEWQEALQSRDDTREMFGGMTFFAAVPGQDPVSKDPILTKKVYMQVQSTASVSGSRVLRDLVARFDAAPATASCKSEHPQPGYLSLRIDLVAHEGRFDVAAGGTLAVEPGGRCLRAVLDELIASTVIPPGALGAALFHTVEVL